MAEPADVLRGLRDHLDKTAETNLRAAGAEKDVHAANLLRERAATLICTIETNPQEY